MTHKTPSTRSGLKPLVAKQRLSGRTGTAVGLSPFAIYVLLFFGLPLIAVATGAFAKNTGGFTFDNVKMAWQGQYRHGFITSLELASLTAVVPGVAGLLLAYAIQTARRGALLRRLVTAASGVFANFGGVPLAFLFIASLGSTGVATKWLNAVGLNPYKHGFSLYTFAGLALVYCYFQIPLMVLVITPALEGLRPSWREAASGLGASPWSYWRYVGGPVLLPSFLGSVLLLFGFGLSAYATAEALSSGIAITSVQIGTFLNGNVLPGQENVGKALGLEIVLVSGLAMVVYTILQRRASRWLR